MRFWTVTSIALLVFGSALAQSTNTTNSPDALEMLERVGRHYAQAKTFRIEMVEESTTINEYQHGWQKSVMVAAEAPGNLFHYEGRSSAGSAITISDGTDTWTYHVDSHSYTKRPNPDSSLDEAVPTPFSELAMQRAKGLRDHLATFATSYKSAHRLPDQVLHIGRAKIPCYVVKVVSTDLKRRTPNFSSELTLWIEPARNLVLQASEHDQMPAGTDHIPVEMNTRTTYQLTELDSLIPASVFTFDPPGDAKLVPHFPNPMNPDADLAGQSLPELTLRSADGKLVSLSSFRGKPVLIDLWSTWCPPCIKSLPQLAQLHSEVKDKGIALVTIDRDEEARIASDYLAQRGYSWLNLHDEGEAATALGESGIPRTLIVDQQGKVVFDKIVATDAEMRQQLAKLGPEYAFLTPQSGTAPCSVEKR